MKKLLFITLILLLALSFSACSSTGSGKPTSAEIESQGQALAEKILDDFVEPDIINDIDITGKEWPDNEYTLLIPRPESGTIDFCMFNPVQTVISIIWTSDEAEAYAELIKQAGYTIDSGDRYEDGIFKSYWGYNEDGIFVSVSEEGLRMRTEF